VADSLTGRSHSGWRGIIQTILADEMNDQPLPIPHDAPLRLCVETQRGVKMVMWLRAIEFVEDDRTRRRGHGRLARRRSGRRHRSGPLSQSSVVGRLDKTAGSPQRLPDKEKTVRPLRPTGPRIRRPQGRWTDWAILILSIWLFMSPWVLSTIVVTTRGPDGGSFMARGANPGDFWGVGAALFVVALWALTTPWARWMEQSAALLAVWLFISPWVLGFALFRAAWDAWIVAILVWLLALAALAVIPPASVWRRPMGRVARRRDHPPTP